MQITKLNLSHYHILPPIMRMSRLSLAMAEAFLKWEGPKPMARFSSPTTKTGSGVARNFKRGGGGRHNFYVFCQAYFFGGTNLKLTEKQKRR